MTTYPNSHRDKACAAASHADATRALHDTMRDTRPHFYRMLSYLLLCGKDPQRVYRVMGALAADTVEFSGQHSPGLTAGCIAATIEQLSGVEVCQ